MFSFERRTLIHSQEMPPKDRAKANQTKDATYPVVKQPVAPVVANQNVSAT